MDISKLASTVILATAFATILLFAFLFFLYGDFANALSMTAGFFGGIATLVAAYVATQLFNDWKKEAKYTRNTQVLNEFWDNYIDVKTKLVSLSDLLGRRSIQRDKRLAAPLLDGVNESLVKLYFYQAKLEVILEIGDSDPIFSEMEDIIREYMKILHVDDYIYSSFLEEEALLINRINTLQPKLLKHLKTLNENSFT
ncbi:hypothetical protein KTI62_15165 [Acinetobacter schindleri]|uniref:hypothetical protein n=1 Tax=Acinetobacter schindleri TaxID=108981 RepID=UPI0021CD25FA|nr:hypothetical protein [Acinetobacter schindleri]MCU4521485.1 hypothetical protein [Acinetobacter schindleri]